MSRIDSFLRNADTDSFRSADEFADAIVEEVKAAYQGSFESARAVAVIRRTTKDIYTWYRLRDGTVFGSAKAPRLKFGAADTRAVNFFNDLDSWYFSSFVDNRRDELHGFFKKTYLDQGSAALRETVESIEEFRRAAGGKLDRVNDFGVKTIIRSSVQRMRNYAHIKQLSQGRYKLAKIIAIIDARTTPICHFLDGKYIRVGVMAETVDRLTKMDPGEYALELYKSATGRAYAQDPVDYVKDRIGEGGVVEDSLVVEGRGFPPYHPNCRTRVEAVIPGAGEPKSGAEQGYDN